MVLDTTSKTRTLRQTFKNSYSRSPKSRGTILGSEEGSEQAFRRSLETHKVTDKESNPYFLGTFIV